MRWYSSKNTAGMVLRALTAALVGALLKYVFDLQSVSWGVVLGVPIMLLLLNFLFRETPGSKTESGKGNGA